MMATATTQLDRRRKGTSAETTRFRYSFQKQNGRRKTAGFVLFSFLSMAAVAIVFVGVANLTVVNQESTQAALRGSDSPNQPATVTPTSSSAAKVAAVSKDVEAVNRKRGIWVRPEFLQHLKTLGPIPRKIHLFWPKKTLLDHMELSMVKNGVGQLAQMNPAWEVTIYNDDDIDNVIQQSTDLLSVEELKLLKIAHIVEKTDVARLILMYRHGGLYADPDKWFNKEIDPILRNSTLGTNMPAMCLPSFEDINFAQDLLCSAPGNNIWKWHIERSSQIRLTGGYNGDKGIKPLVRMPNGWLEDRSDLFKLGPPVYNDVIFTHVFDGPLAQDEIKRRYHIPRPPKTTMAAARQALQHSMSPGYAGLIVTAYNKGCDGLLSSSDENGRCPGIDKTAAQRLFGMKQWDKEVKELADAAKNKK